jgi:outer membrane receptor protein involved in Fe transport
MIPTKPQLDRFSGRLSASYSGTSGGGSGNSMIQGVVNLPLVEDELAVRVVGYRYDDSGFYRNIAGADPATLATLQTFGLGDLINGYVQDHVGDLRSTGGRLSASWKVTDDLNLTMNVLTQKLEQNGTPAATVGSFDQVAIPIAAPGRVRGEAGDVNDTKINLANLVLSYDLQWAAVTSAVSWVDSGSAQTTSGLAPFPFSTTLRPSDFKSFTAETRLASHLEGRFQFISGLFYENVEEQHLGTTYWPGTPETSPLGTAVLFTSSVARDRDQRALFGEVSYDLTSQLTATVGGRHFEYDKDEQSQLVFAGTPSGSSDLNSSESGNTFKASLSYEPTDRSLLYASWAEGFRLGRPQAGLPSAACDVNGDGLIDGTGTSIESTRRVESDSLENYEVGSKLSLFDRRIVMDAAVYHIDWEGLPIGVTVGCTLVGYTANAGRARSDGAELQASVLVAEGLRVDFGGSYTKARLAEDAPALNAEKGARLPGSPKVNANLAVQYDFLLAGHEAFVRADSLYTGDFYGDLQESAQTRAGDYIKLDARVGVRLKSLSVEAFVRNLTNEAASTWRSVSPQTGLFSDYRLRPRTVGIQLGYSFE